MQWKKTKKNTTLNDYSAQNKSHDVNLDEINESASQIKKKTEKDKQSIYFCPSASLKH